MISPERVRKLNNQRITDRPYVVYWMQSSQRAEYNHALEYSIRQANLLQKPLIVYFGVTDQFPEANERHYRFPLEGLQDVKAELAKRSIPMWIRKISPEEGAVELSALSARMVVDRGYLRVERQWRESLADRADCLVEQVETNVLVPVETASVKEEFSAATLRPKIHKLLEQFAFPLQNTELLFPLGQTELPFESFDIEDVDRALNQLRMDRSVKAVSFFKGGTFHAKELLEEFIDQKLKFYGEQKNEPGLGYTSNLSPYLHFGQISPLYIYRRLLEVPFELKEAFLEELIVRRELSMNFVYYNAQYDSYASVPAWARATLEKHQADARAYLYTRQEMEEANTHDVYWNAAQQEMVLTGKMNGYMRMYWGKKILEWSPTAEEAFSIALFLNNKYNLDGRDPCSFTGVSWCFGKHDRPWGERAIFGNIRYMNAKGLERKFDMQKYLDWVEQTEGLPIPRLF